MIGPEDVLRDDFSKGEDTYHQAMRILYLLIYTTTNETTAPSIRKPRSILHIIYWGEEISISDSERPDQCNQNRER